MAVGVIVEVGQVASEDTSEPSPPLTPKVFILALTEL